jgi:hypothetical protein
MRFSLDVDDFGRLACLLGDDTEQRTVFAADPLPALEGLRAAIEDAEKDGMGECFWLVSEGEYRWVLRRDGARLRLAVLHCRSVAIGFEHVYWGESDWADSSGLMRFELDRLAAELAGAPPAE